MAGQRASLDKPNQRRNSDVFDIAQLQCLVSEESKLASYPLAEEVIDNVVIYDNHTLVSAQTTVSTQSVLDELAEVLDTGPGVFVIRNAIAHDVLDRATRAFETMIVEQRSAGRVAGDHFAAAGANDRVWNALEKLALSNPEDFVDYYACEAIRVASLSWLGPAYQVTSQINVVNPGGQAQNPHCDYHLGFMSTEQAAAYPPRVHAMSRMLTLQGAIAHRDMPVESGPTKLLPHSQKYAGGYEFSAQPEVAALFEQRFVQIPMRAGDSIFFNPAMIHAAGTNFTTDVRRMANLLQISSAFGRAMESVDRRAMCLSIYPALRQRQHDGWAAHRLEQVLACCAEGYAFPTNLDRDPPIGGLAPPSQADVMKGALAASLSDSTLDELLRHHAERRQTT
jgi:ectoine hydroxylase-related dioxygenase (phytanoyl-CoA dioxygenase family)